MPGTTINNVAYSLNQPLSAIFNPPVIAKRDPLTSDKAPIGQMWVNTSSNAVFVLTSITNNTANWMDITEGAGMFTSLTVNPGPTNLSTVGVGAVTIGNSANTAAVTLSSGSGGIALVGNGHTITVGNDSAANTVTVGSFTNGATTNIIGGNGTGVGTAAITIDSASSGDVVVGGQNQTGAIYVGPSTAGVTVNVANQVNVNPQIVNISTGASGANSTVNVLTGVATAGAQTFNVLTGLLSTAGAVNIATGTAAHVVTMGSVTGAASTTLKAGTGGLIFSPTTGNMSAVPATVSGASTTPTLNARFGTVTVTGLTTASAATQVVTIANTTVTTSSMILASAYNLNASANGAAIGINGIVVGANSLAITLKNNGGGSLGAGDNVVISFWVVS